MSRITLRDGLRYGAVICAALALAYGARVWDDAANDVTLRYLGAPRGPMTVDLRDADGERMRRTEFSAGVARSHAVQLPRGEFQARLRVGEATRTRRFVVAGDGVIELKWWASAPGDPDERP